MSFSFKIDPALARFLVLVALSLIGGSCAPW